MHSARAQGMQCLSMIRRDAADRAQGGSGHCQLRRGQPHPARARLLRPGQHRQAVAALLWRCVCWIALAPSFIPSQGQHLSNVCSDLHTSASARA